LGGSESVFNIIQFGAQSGTAYAPGSAVAATVLVPVDSPVNFVLDRVSTYPKQDRGRNVRNTAGQGYFGIRAADCVLPMQASFEYLADLLEMHASGGVTPTGVGPYVWVYPFERVTPTLIPRTIEGGNTDVTQAQMRMTSCLIDQLTMGFPDLIAPGSYPWTISANVFGFDRSITTLTGSLSGRTGMEVMQGHLTTLLEGTTSTAFASLTEIAGTLKAYTQTTNRNLARRAYGGSTDLPTRFGFKDMSNGTFEAKLAISATSKSDFHDIWNVASPAPLGERRWRIKVIGTGTKVMTIDARVGIFAVPTDEVDGERIFKVTGEFVDDDTLSAPLTWTITNSIASL
jgi:hypothetical protein